MLRMRLAWAATVSEHPLVCFRLLVGVLSSMGKDKHKGKEKPAGLGSVPAAGKAKGPEALVPIGARMRATKRQRDEDEDEAGKTASDSAGSLMKA